MSAALCLRNYFKTIADTKVGESADSKHSNTSCRLGLSRALAARADSPEITFEILSRHSSAIVAHENFLILDGYINSIPLIGRIHAISQGLDPHRIDSVLHVLADECEWRLIYLLRNRPKDALEVDADLKRCAPFSHVGLSPLGIPRAVSGIHDPQSSRQ